MNYKIFFIFLFLFSNNFCSKSVAVSVKAERHNKLKIKLIVPGHRKTDKVAKIIKKDLEFSGQFEVIIKNNKNGVLRKSDITNYFEPECRLGIFLEKAKKNTFNWRLYDLEHALMVKGEKYKAKGKDVYWWSHNIADSIWPHLTGGEKGCFSTKIVYCKKINRGEKKSYTHIYISYYDGSREELKISTPTVNIAPRLNNDPKRPLIFYSEHTNKNVRLMVADMNGRRKVASNFDGLNILSSFSPDGKRFAYCASRGGGSCQIYYFDGELKKLTNAGNNLSPTFADNGDSIYFCSDANSKCPQIYKYNLSKKDDPRYKPERILKSGFQVSTVFNPSKGILAYSQMVAGLMQLFVYDPSEKTHKQLTFGAGNKEECSWSPCGNYLLFSVAQNNNSRLAIINLPTGVIKFISKSSDNCYYPFWSPIYEKNFAIS